MLGLNSWLNGVTFLGEKPLLRQSFFDPMARFGDEPWENQEDHDARAGIPDGESECPLRPTSLGLPTVVDHQT